VIELPLFVYSVTKTLGSFPVFVLAAPFGQAIQPVCDRRPGPEIICCPGIFKQQCASSYKSYNAVVSGLSSAPMRIVVCQLSPAADMPAALALGSFVPRGDIVIAADLLIIPRAELQSIDFFLSHAQMDPESLQVDFEWACNLE
jgi:hypothetical protein